MDFNNIAAVDFSKVFSPLDAPTGRVPNHKSGSLSFGVEIEFAVAVLGSAEEDPHPNDDRPVKGLLAPSARHLQGIESANQEAVEESIARKLNKTFKNVVIHTKDMGVDVAHQFWAKGGDISSLPIPARLSSPRKPRLPAGEWIIKDDVSIRAPDIPGAEKYGWIPIEVNSPPLLFSEEALYHVKEVVEHLSNSHRYNINKSCGMHVHISHQYEGYTLRHLKNIAAILWTFEPLFFDLVNETRYGNRDCQFWHSSSRLKTNLGAQKTVNFLSKGLELIFAASSIDIENLRDPTGPSTDPLKRTIEIRIHESTMDPQGVENWVRLFIGLVQFADVVSVENLEEWLREHINDERGDYDAIQLTYALKLPQQAHYYLNKLLPRYIEVPADEVERLLRIVDDAVVNAGLGT